LQERRVMKNATRLLVLVSLFVPIAAMAQTTDCNSVTLDENGNGTYFQDGVYTTTYFTGVVTLDPSGGVPGGQALVYTLPFNFTQPGDYLLTEKEDPSISDVVRFWGTNQVIFYSSETDEDNPTNPTPFDLADVGLPINSLTPSFVLQPPPDWVTGWEGFVPIEYGETGQPGFPGFPLHYVFESIPEPSTLALVGVGLAGVTLMAYRRRSK
jgi:hypothetical protein